jgi:hypothetical protein
MTEVLLVPLPLPRFATFEWLNRPLKRNDLAWKQVLADEVLVSLAAGGLVEIDNRHGNFAPPEHPASFEPPLPGDQTAFWCHHHRMKHPHLGDAIRERPKVAQVLAVPKADLDLIDVHSSSI